MLYLQSLSADYSRTSISNKRVYSLFQMPSRHDWGEVGPLIFGCLIVMTFDSARVRKVVESYCWHVQWAVSATCLSVSIIDESDQSGWYLRRVVVGHPRTSRDYRIATTTLRKCVLSTAPSLGVGSAFWTLTKFYVPIPQTRNIINVSRPHIPTIHQVLRQLRTIVNAESFVFLIFQVHRLCTQVGWTW